MLDQYLPAGYERKSMGDFHALQGAVIEVRVMQKAPVEEVQNVKINYYDEAAGKQVAEVPVQVSSNASVVDMAILTRLSSKQDIHLKALIVKLEEDMYMYP